MNTLEVRFGFRMPSLDSEGFIYCKYARDLEDYEIIQALHTDFVHCFGGYIVVVDGLVWNSSGHPSTEINDLRFPVDSLSFSRALLEDFVLQVDESEEFLCSFTETTSLRFRRMSHSRVEIDVVDGDQVVYSSLEVDIRPFLLALISATDDALAVLQRSLVLRSVRGAVASGAVSTDARFYEQWRDTRLRAQSWLEAAFPDK